MSDQAQLHKRLIHTLADSGNLRTEPWKRAAEEVPRHEFLRGGFFRRVEGAVPAAWASVPETDPGWMDACYTDESLVTQIAGTIMPTDIRGQIMRQPTSSSTLPSLVLRMLEDLEIEDGMRVLEIGTGTGYSTALLCRRLGEENVTSIEYDEDVAARARTSLGRLGMHPTLVAGDGLRGYGSGAPYDRVIATCAVRTIPSAWIEQTRPGGVILATIGGWLGSSGLAKLTVRDAGTASGPLLDGEVSFMLARPHTPPALGLLPDLSAGSSRPATFGSDILDDWSARFVVQAAVPGAQRLALQHEGQTEDVLVDVGADSWAALRQQGDHWTVRQGGPESLWDAAERQLKRWRAAGSPALEDMTVTVTPGGIAYDW
ncbi:ATP-grasp peptide maturase system methyltransferase [Streptomyces sp. NPDC014748]|uniref:ATP-grasp peptide maturase system methyltransferase n=1 Tax=Streptomyces sp. NPDC014748 TaxID=3364905 RepID=UPI0036FB8BDC